MFISNHQCAEQDTRPWHKTFEDSTLAFYMPGGKLKNLQAELLENGLDPEIPCLVISQAALPAQEVIRTTIRGLANLPRTAAPSLLIVGATGADARADFCVETSQLEQRHACDEIVLQLAQSAELPSN